MDEAYVEMRLRKYGLDGFDRKAVEPIWRRLLELDQTSRCIVHGFQPPKLSDYNASRLRVMPPKYEKPFPALAYTCCQRTIVFEELLVALRDDIQNGYELYLSDHNFAQASGQFILCQNVPEIDFIWLSRINAAVRYCCTDVVVEKFMEWREKYSAFLIGSNRNTLFLGFNKIPDCPEAFAEEALELCPEISFMGITKEIICESVRGTRRFNFRWEDA